MDYVNEINDIFIHLENNSLEKDVCDEIINRFNNDERKTPGKVLSGLIVSVKNTIELSISGRSGWDDIDKLLHSKLNSALSNYINKHVIVNNGQSCGLNNPCFKNIRDYGYNIQKYYANEGFYVWHNDFVDKESLQTFQQVRLITFIWYLNDVSEGGETEFINGKIKPVAGNLLLFPSTWNYYHRGNIPKSNDKYIITGWVGY